LNQKQKYAFGLIITIVLFIIAYAIADKLDRPFDFKDIWYVWIIGLGIVGWLWNKILGDTNG
jgi:tetrahydromethanopterin S-methyltransferase subunit E